MITPIWCTDYPADAGQTTFRLQLMPSESAEALAEHATTLEPSILLFLRQLSMLKIETCLTGQDPWDVHLKRETTNDPDVVKLTHWRGSRMTRDDYFVVRHTVQGMPDDDKRKGITSSEVTLAFPIDKNGAPIAREEYAHAFLPLRKYGFKFVIQADFLTPASREDILEDKPWNITIRNGLLAAVLAAVERLKRRENMKFTWFRFLPLESDISNAYFRPLANHIRQSLIAKELFLSQDGQFCTAARLLILPSWATYQDSGEAHAQPIIPEKHLPPFTRYLHESYDTTTTRADGSLLEGLGLKQLSGAQFIKSLQGIIADRLHERLSARWFDAVIHNLVRLHETTAPPPGRRRKPAPYVHRDAIWALKLIPLSDGSWVSKSSNMIIYFDFALGDIPDDLGIYRLRSGVDMSRSRQHFYSLMGVNIAEPSAIAKLIMGLHREVARAPSSLPSLLKHARFLFTHREGLQNERISVVNLLLLDANSEVGQGKDLYLPGGEGIPLETVLPSPPARFLHQGYVDMYADDPATKAKWLKWLCDSTGGPGVQASPRVTSDGRLSVEAALMLQTVSTPQLLAVLRYHWAGGFGSSRLSRDATSQISNTLVGCGDARVPLKATYIKRNSLAEDTSGLPFLPIDDPQNPEWDFLRRFGVATEINGSFYLRQLKQLQSQGGEQNEDDMNALYRQLEARFSDDSVSIREAFRKFPLIYNHKKKVWCAFADAVWTGPPNMRFKTSVQTLYPHQEAFFCRHLNLAKPSHAVLIVDEVEQFVGQVQDKPLAAAGLKQGMEILSDLSRFIHQHPEEVLQDDGPLRVLRNLRIFPVRLPDTGEVVLRRVTDQPFYVPDVKDQYKQLFNQSVPLLVVNTAVEHSKLRALLDCDIFIGLVRLEDAVKIENPAFIKKHKDAKLTKTYQSKTEYYVRFCYHHHRYHPPPSVKQALSRLKNLKIFVADSITLTYVLADVRKTQPVEVFFDEKKIWMYLDKRQIAKPIQHQHLIAGKLASLFQMEDTLVQLICSTTAPNLEHTCTQKKIASLDDKTFNDFEWLREAADSESDSESSDELEDDDLPTAGTIQAGNVHTPSQRGHLRQSQRLQRHPSPSASPSPDPRLRSTRRRSGTHADTQPTSTLRASTQPNTPHVVDEEEDDVDQLEEGDIAMVHRGAAANMQLVREHTRDPRRCGLKRKAARGLVGSPAKRSRADADGAAGSAQGSVKSDEGDGEVEVEVEDDEDDIQVDPVEDIPDDAPQRVIDILGEHFVFSYLLTVLPGFGAENWTSTSRGHIPNFEPYEGDAVGNITYHDGEGELTRFLHGGMDKSEWAGAYPTYHILVKSTTGAHETPFILSQREVETAADMALSVEVVPTDVLAVIRVSGPRGKQTCKAYVDPHGCLHQNSIRGHSDLVCTAAL